ncbi:hypothetical protein MCC10112_0665 [Bifidobacterium longum subsp. longum]|nr:hypothetical protein MCC10097_0546 [Bifidobacterium longum subsp. longum]TCF58087.1 hypothetical protein MCC10112_0665 [Bifidobacterium longum subsp. longum]
MVAGGVPPSALFGESMAELTGGPMAESTDDAADESTDDAADESTDDAADESAAAVPLDPDAPTAGSATPLDLIASASRIALIMLRHVGLEVAHPRNDPDWMAFWSMTRFIYYHYGERLTIEDIARADGMLLMSI